MEDQGVYLWIYEQEGQETEVKVVPANDSEAVALLKLVDDVFINIGETTEEQSAAVEALSTMERLDSIESNTAYNVVAVIRSGWF